MLSPLGVTLIQSAILNAFSNILAQLIDQYKHGVCISTFHFFPSVCPFCIFQQWKLFCPLGACAYCGVHLIYISNERFNSPSPFCSIICIAKALFLGRIIANTHVQKPLSLNVIALIQFVTYAVIIVPMNFSWQRYVEAKFPGFPSTAGWRRGRASPPSSSSVVSSSPAFFTTPTAPPPDVLPRKEKPARDAVPATGSNSGMRNFIIKFMLDQTIAGFVNIVIFIFLINLLKGANLSTIWDLICEVCIRVYSFIPILVRLEALVISQISQMSLRERY